jgi:beta-lactamase class A
VYRYYVTKKCYDKFTFIDAGHACGNDTVINKVGYIGLQRKIEAYIVDQKIAGHLADASVYFRDLEDGPIFGINQDEDFAPASLLKLPLALVYLTEAEKDSNILKEKISVAVPQWGFERAFASGEEIDPRVPHTVESLLSSMLINSDNNAYGVLQTHLYDIGKINTVVQTFVDFGFVSPADLTDEVLSVRRYGAIFRSLYHLAYLNAEFSEQVLDWLSQSTFKQGLPAGVPAEIKVAHKFGERYTDDGKKQLHDCGIIYYPENPYLLCVMTSGTNFDDLVSVIRYISQEVYKEVDSRRI